MIIEVSALGGISRKRWDRYLETVGFEEHSIDPACLTLSSLATESLHVLCHIMLRFYPLPFNTIDQRHQWHQNPLWILIIQLYIIIISIILAHQHISVPSARRLLAKWVRFKQDSACQKRATQKGVRVQERLEFNEGDVGLAGGIQADSMRRLTWIILDSCRAAFEWKRCRTTRKICYLNPPQNVLIWGFILKYQIMIQPDILQDAAKKQEFPVPRKASGYPFFMRYCLYGRVEKDPKWESKWKLCGVPPKISTDH